MIFPIYVTTYVLLVVFYLWYRFILKFISDVREQKEYPEYKAKVSVLVPVYNEEDYILDMCIEKLINANGDNEIIVIDDKSTNQTWEKLQQLKKKYPQIKIIHLKENKGKREAQYIGLKFITGDIIVTIDSDSLVDKNSLIELIKPFNDTKVGAVTGQVKARNREVNLLTKMIDARYLNAFSFERSAQSSFGIVTCCSGAISAYRRELFDRFKEDYINQFFLKKKCTYGDDRYMTNLILKAGYDIKYVRKAIARTEVPYTYGKFFKQQIRWKKSFIRESLVTFTYTFNKKKWLLALETSLGFILPLISLFARLFMIYLIFTFPLSLIPLVISIAFIAIIRNMLLFMEEGKIAIYSIPYAILHEIVIYWLYWYALFTLNDTKWGTR